MLSGRETNEVPEVIVRRLRLRVGAIRFLLGSMDQVWELYRVLNEEHRDVVANDVPVALLSVELYGEAANVARKIRRAFVAGNRREPDEGGRPLPGALKQIGARVF